MHCEDPLTWPIWLWVHFLLGEDSIQNCVRLYSPANWAYSRFIHATSIVFCWEKKVLKPCFETVGSWFTSSDQLPPSHGLTSSSYALQLLVAG